MNPRALAALLGSLAAACPKGWDPVRSLTSGEGMQRSGPRALDFEHGVGLPQGPGMPAWSPVGPPSSRALTQPWAPIALGTEGARCFAVKVSFSQVGANDPGPLSEPARWAGGTLVVRDAAGEVVAPTKTRAAPWRFATGRPRRWQLNDDPATAGESTLPAEAVLDCDRVRCWAVADDGVTNLGSNVGDIASSSVESDARSN